MTGNDYLEQLRSRLAETVQRIGALRAELDELEATRQRLASAITAVELVESPLPVTGTTVMIGRGVVRPTGTVTFRRFATPARTLPEAAELVLTEVGAPMHLKDLIPKIQANGFHADRSFEEVRASLASTLDRKVSRHDTFTKVGPGTYGLLSWDSPVLPLG